MTDPSIANKVAIITGSSKGIGNTLAKGFAEAEASVVLVARSVPNLEATAREITTKGGKAISVPADITIEEQVHLMVETALTEFGRIDILVNCAGGAGSKPFIPLLDMDESSWDKVIDLNLKSVYLCCRAAGRVMVEQKSGSIINFSSGAGIVPVPGETHYGAAKAGVNQLTRALAAEWGRYNVRVNAISPGLIATQASKELVNSDAYEKYVRAIPLGRAGEPEDILGIALFLASEASAFITGAIVPVGGGPQ